MLYTNKMIIKYLIFITLILKYCQQHDYVFECGPTVCIYKLYN